MRYAAWRRVPSDERRRRRGASVVRPRLGHRAAGRPRRSAEWLPAEAAAELLAAYGIEHVGTAARGASAVAAAAQSIGYPVVVKVADTGVRAQDRPRAGAGRASARRTAVAVAVAEFAAELGVAADDLDVRVQPVVHGVEVASAWCGTRCSGRWCGWRPAASPATCCRTRCTCCPRRTLRRGAGAARAAAVATPRRLPRHGPGRRRRPGGAGGRRRPARGRRTPGRPPRPQPGLRRPRRAHCVDVKLLLSPAEALDVGFPRRLRPLS